MSPAIARLTTIVLDCPEPAKLAAFYAALLGHEVAGAEGDWVQLAGPEPVLAFQRATDHQPPQWPDGPPQQVHLDVEVDGYEVAHELVVSMGATPLEPTTPPSAGEAPGFRVYADPAGHPFCLCLP
jgi:hypothetical protein